MNLKNSIFVSAFVFASSLGAHSSGQFSHLSKEKMLDAIALLASQNECLKAELVKAHHKLDEHHRVHELERAILHLLK